MTESGRSKEPMLSVDAILGILRTSVGQIEAFAADAPPSELEPTGYEDEWSAAAVLAHLRACNDVLGSAMLRIIREEHPAWTATSPRTWQAKSGYHELPFEVNLEALRRGRAELLDVLEAVGPAAWERTAAVRVPPRNVYERSTRYYGDWLAQHEGTHMRDLARRRRDTKTARRDAGSRP